MNALLPFHPPLPAPMDPLARICARLEDLPPPLCEWARFTIRHATSADIALHVADGADEAAREAEFMLRGDKDAAAFRLMANLLREAAPILSARKEGCNVMG